MSTEKKLVFVGKVTRAHGVRGELKVLEGLGASGAWRAGGEVFIGRSAETAECFRVLRVRTTGRFTLLVLEGVVDRNRAERLRDQRVYVARERLPDLEEGEYYASDLLGMLVEDTKGRHLGVLGAIFDNGAHEIYVVEDGSTQILLPVIEGVVTAVDPDAGKMVVDPPEGLDGLS